MIQTPQAAQDLVAKLSPAFTKPTALRMVSFALATIITIGRRTVTATLIVAVGMLTGHFTTYYRLFSRPAWSPWVLCRLLARLVIELVPPDEPILLLVDDSVTEHPGKNVWGKAKHRDAVRSSHSLTKWIWGHKWVVLAISIKFPWAKRAWALPVFCALYTPPEESERLGRKHRTCGELARVLVRRLIQWFPERRFILTGDGQYSTHEMARFAHRHRKQLTYVGKFYPDANMYEQPPEYAGNGRPRVKGQRQQKPEEVIQTKRGFQTTVNWYGGGERKVRLVRGGGNWFKAGFGLVAVSFVHVEDLEGTHRPEYFFSSDPQMSAHALVNFYVNRWSIEVTFQECKDRLGLGSPRRFSQKAVQRVEPWLLGLFSVVSLIYHTHLQTHPVQVLNWPWYQKTDPTFSTALGCVRRLIWDEGIFSQPHFAGAVEKLPRKFKDYLLNRLTQAA
jgi:hypothetical protein